MQRGAGCVTALLMSGEPPTRRQRENTSGHNQSLVGFDSFVICSAATCQSSAEPSMQNGFVRVEASCDVSSASIRIDLATPRVAHVNRGCCLQMVPRGSNAHYFSIQASPAPTSPPEFFLHSHMHNIAAAGGPPDWPTESPDRRRCRAKSIVDRSIACIACCSVLIFCLLGLRTYLAHQRGRNLAAQRDISCACCSTKQGLQPTRSIIVVAMRERIFVKRSRSDRRDPRRQP